MRSIHVYIHKRTQHSHRRLAVVAGGRDPRDVRGVSWVKMDPSRTRSRRRSARRAAAVAVGCTSPSVAAAALHNHRNGATEHVEGTAQNRTPRKARQRGRRRLRGSLSRNDEEEEGMVATSQSCCNRNREGITITPGTQSPSLVQVACQLAAS